MQLYDCPAPLRATPQTLVKLSEITCVCTIKIKTALRNCSESDFKQWHTVHKVHSLTHQVYSSISMLCYFIHLLQSEDFSWQLLLTVRGLKKKKKYKAYKIQYRAFTIQCILILKVKPCNRVLKSLNALHLGQVHHLNAVIVMHHTNDNPILS